MTHTARSFTNGPIASESCREYILELMDLLQLYMSMEQETDVQEGLLLTNAVISTCDSMLRTYDPQRHASINQCPIDSPVFYQIYGSALLSLLFRAISSYPAEISSILDEEHDETKLLKMYHEKVVPLRKYQRILAETAMEYCIEGYKRSMLPVPGALIPNEQERNDSDPGAFDLFDILGNTMGARELFVESLLAASFVNRNTLSLINLINEVSEHEPTVSKELLEEIIRSKSSYFIQHLILYIQAELKWSEKLGNVASDLDLSSRMENDEIVPCEPNWTLIDVDDYGSKESDDENDSLEDVTITTTEDEEEDEDEEDEEEDDEEEEDAEHASSNDDIQQTECLLEDFESEFNPKERCSTTASKALGIDGSYLSICVLRELMAPTEKPNSNI